MKHGLIPINTLLYLQSDVDALLLTKAAAADVTALQGQVAAMLTSSAGTTAQVFALQTFVGSTPLGTAATHAATDFILANDPRLSDTRTAKPHAASHATGGADALPPSSIGAASATDSRLALAATAVQPSALGSVASHAVTEFATAAQGAKADTAIQLLPAATTAFIGCVRKAAALTIPTPALTVPTLITGTVSLVTVQAMQNRFEQLVTNLQAAGVLA